MKVRVATKSRRAPDIVFIHDEAPPVDPLAELVKTRLAELEGDEPVQERQRLRAVDPEPECPTPRR
jgi:hypothetical protein